MNVFFLLLQRVFLAWRGRLVALCFLAGVVLASLGSEDIFPKEWRHRSAGDVLRVVGTPFAAARQALFDSYQNFIPRIRQSQPVTIVEIDERSLKAIGQWPWPRNRLAGLIDKIAEQKPLAIGLDLYMPEVDETSPGRVANNLPAGQEALAMALRKLPSHEEDLIRS